MGACCSKNSVNPDENTNGATSTSDGAADVGGFCGLGSPKEAKQGYGRSGVGADLFKVLSIGGLSETDGTMTVRMTEGLMARSDLPSLCLIDDKESKGQSCRLQ